MQTTKSLCVSVPLHLIDSTILFCAGVDRPRLSRGSFAVILAQVGLLFFLKQAKHILSCHTLKTQPIAPKIDRHSYMDAMTDAMPLVWGILNLCNAHN